MNSNRHNPPQSIAFSKDNFQASFIEWNKLNDNALTNWLNNGQMLKINDLLYIGKENFHNMESQLAEYLKILDVNIVNLNPGMDKEIRQYCAYKESEVKKILDQYFTHITDKDTFVKPFRSICSRIIQQPIYILDAIEQYPDSQNKEQIIYNRHNDIHGKIRFAKDKFTIFNIELERLFNYQLAKGDNNKPLLNLFLFTDQFINELKYYNPTGVNYFKTPLFIEFFNSIIKYKKRYITVFGDFCFENINEVELILNDFQTQQTEKKAKLLEKSISLDIPENLTPPHTTEMWIDPLEYLNSKKAGIIDDLVKNYPEMNWDEFYKSIEILINELEAYVTDKDKTKTILSTELLKDKYSTCPLLEVWLLKALYVDDLFKYAYNYLARKIASEAGLIVPTKNDLTDIDIFEINKKRTLIKNKLTPPPSESIDNSNETKILSIADWAIIFYYIDESGDKKGYKNERRKKFIADKKIITTTGNFKKEYHELSNRINLTESTKGKPISPLPPKRIEKILPYLKKNKKATEKAKKDINRLVNEINEYRDNIENNY